MTGIGELVGAVRTVSGNLTFLTRDGGHTGRIDGVSDLNLGFYLKGKSRRSIYFGNFFLCFCVSGD